MRNWLKNLVCRPEAVNNKQFPYEKPLSADCADLADFSLENLSNLGSSGA